MKDSISATELASIIQSELDEIKPDLEAWEERVALAMPEDGLTTDERALAALRLNERYSGEHQVARTWLLNSTTARCWKANGHE